MYLPLLFIDLMRCIFLDGDCSESPAKRLRQEENLRATFEQLMESMNYGRGKKSRKV